MKKNICSLKKGLDILCCFDFKHEFLTAQMVSEQLGMPLSTAYRYLDTLEECGFLIKHRDDKKYIAGYVLLQMGNIVTSRMDFVDIITPHMEKLLSLSGETVLLTVLSGLKTVCVKTIESNKLIKVSLQRGLALPLHAGASSKVILTYQKDSWIDSILRRTALTKVTEYTITDPSALKEELNTIRNSGFAFADQEVDLGVAAISSPVFDRKGRLVASLTIAGPRERIIENKSGFSELIKKFAMESSYDLGYREHV